MIQARAWVRITMAAALAVVVGGCEPLDTGGGGGAGDEGAVAFIRDGRLAYSSADGTGLQFHTNSGTFATDPALAPNGQTIAFAYSPENDESATGIFLAVKGAATGVLTELASGGKFTSPTWDPASSNVYYVASGELFRVPSAGGTAPVQVAASVTDAKWIAAINSTTLLVANTSGALSQVVIGTGASTPLNVNTTSAPAVSADGKLAAYSNADGVIVVRDLTAGSETLMPAGSSSDANPSFSPDGTLVAFDSGGSIYRTSVSGTSNRQSFFTSATNPSWSQ
jgi:Tol biopolymer transport system component